ncbi:MAG: DnaD domain protein [Lachnospiraceae bacterium]|nr:DnaD domain protein [Lachnospiraceae bacterium]
MGNIVLHSEQEIHTTTIENTFIDKYMVQANGEFVKVYLFLIRALQAGCTDGSISKIADRLNSSDRDVERALRYWENEGLIVTSKDSLGEISLIRILNCNKEVESDNHVAGTNHNNQAVQTTKSNFMIHMNSIDSSANAKAPGITIPEFNMPTSKVKKQMQDSSDSYNINRSNMNSGSMNSGNMNSDSMSSGNNNETSEDQEIFSWLCSIIETYLNRPIKKNELDVISYVYNDLHFNTDLILHLYEYCIRLGRTSPKYIQSVATNWAENGISTPKEADDYCEKYNDTYNTIKKILGIYKPLAPLHKGYINQWLNEYGMDLEIIIDACERTIKNCGEGDWNYLNGIISRWHNDGVTTMEDVRKADELFLMEKKKKGSNGSNGSNNQSTPKPIKNQFTAFPQRDYSKEEMDELEKKHTF